MAKEDIVTEKEFKEFIDIIEQKDNEIFELQKDAFQEVLGGTKKKTSYKNTVLAISTIFANMQLIKNGVFETCKDDNLYSAKILYRCFLEHWILWQYLLFKSLKESNDEAGIDYFKFRKIGEEVRYGKSMKELYRIAEVEHSDEGIWKIICDVVPDMKQYDMKYVMNKLRQFEYKEMVKYITETTLGGDKKVSALLHKVVPMYSELSSFVHGGPDATIFQVHISGARFAEYKKISEMTFSIIRHTNTLLFSVYSHWIDKKYYKVAELIVKVK